MAVSVIPGLASEGFGINGSVYNDLYGGAQLRDQMLDKTGQLKKKRQAAAGLNAMLPGNAAMDLGLIGGAGA